MKCNSEERSLFGRFERRLRVVWRQTNDIHVTYAVLYGTIFFSSFLKWSTLAESIDFWVGALKWLEKRRRRGSIRRRGCTDLAPQTAQEVTVYGSNSPRKTIKWSNEVSENFWAWSDKLIGNGGYELRQQNLVAVTPARVKWAFSMLHNIRYSQNELEHEYARAIK
jgi:hypothetical protein